MDLIEHARQFRRKAADDERAMSILIDTVESADWIIGFHAQQAVEKLLKCLMCIKGIQFRRIHELDILIDQLIDHGLSIPPAVEAARKLTIFAVDARYGEVPGEPALKLDRAWAAQCVQITRVWVDSISKLI